MTEPSDSQALEEAKAQYLEEFRQQWDPQRWLSVFDAHRGSPDELTSDELVGRLFFELREGFPFLIRDAFIESEVDAGRLVEVEPGRYALNTKREVLYSNGDDGREIELAHRTVAE